MTTALRVAMMGTGGVGGYFGARLADSGHDVAFLARGRHLEAIRRDGLRVHSPLGDLSLPDPRATDDPAEVGPVDMVVVGVKLWDTEQAVSSLAPMQGDRTAVVSLQNGVMKDDVLARTVGAAHVLGGVCYIAATIAEPGVIEHSGSLQRIVIGEFDGTRSPRVEAFRAALADAGVDVDVAVSEQIERTTWEKFVFLVGLSGTTSLARTTIGPIRSHPRSRAFLYDVMDEVVQVARAQGVALPADFADDRLAFVDTVPATMTSSMHRDLERGHRLEVDWLSGDVVARGARLGVSTPANRAIAEVLAVHAEGSAP
ncbi:2-dehydropantoate 2-reductase [Actinomycetospora sp. NBRC 106375]|uniref:ketopantoate reductase family protein n=1 Tax=Actinomycetospora sp. NBRC 106375 TaxID=3032207 RepID=UPI0024A32AED|nr:ketopantoate reductase family protein [Actinomycetospora sp. NBRC 106375]GLZ48983.1 2-dehydropantoate 2-reductase [Actinomycetospora sp. NBRC 106375]